MVTHYQEWKSGWGTEHGFILYYYQYYHHYVKGLQEHEICVLLRHHLDLFFFKGAAIKRY